MDRETQFAELRPLLFSLGYRMLGTRADAEDVVQEAFLRWGRAAEDEIRSARAYLTTVVARLSLDTLKAARRKREVYVGPWLPEPLVEPPGTRPLEMAESLSIAFLHLLESLSPTERAAFLMHEVFETPYSEVASLLETTESNCRQLVARARKALELRPQRFPVDESVQREMLEKFLDACASGDLSQLMAMLEADAVLYSDGGGKVRASLNPVVGADRIARFFAGIRKQGATTGLRVEFVNINGEPGALIYRGEQLVNMLSLELREGRIAAVFLFANPDKLPRIRLKR